MKTTKIKTTKLPKNKKSFFQGLLNNEKNNVLKNYNAKELANEHPLSILTSLAYRNTRVQEVMEELKDKTKTSKVEIKSLKTNMNFEETYIKHLLHTLEISREDINIALQHQQSILGLLNNGAEPRTVNNIMFTTRFDILD